MENQIGTSVPGQPSMIPQPNSILLPILLTLLISAIIFGFGGYYLGRRSALISTATPQITPTPSSPTVADNKGILFEKDEGWGPCPPWGEPCSQNTKLYFSGKLVFAGNKNAEEQLSEATINQVVTQIRSSKIMEKSCEAALVMDYSATYKISLDGKEKTIKFPGCENDLKEIEKIFL